MFSLSSTNPQASTALDDLDRAALVYLVLPLAIFLVGWLEWWVGVPLAVCLAYCLRPLLALRSRRAVGGPPITVLQIAVAVAVGGGWALLGGAGHVFFANADWHIRDAVLHDLVTSAWPVGYGPLDGLESLLRAPVAFYLPAALVGKVLGLGAAHVALGVWTATGAALFLLQVLTLVPARPAVVLTVVAVVVLFSGLDIVGCLLNDGPRFRQDWNITTHLEWWAGKFQYSSMTTQLFWVPNHALGGWLSIGLLSRRRRCTELNELLPIMVVAVALWSPLTALGVVPFVLLRVAGDSLAVRSLRLLHPRVWAPAGIIGLVVCAYLVLDAGRMQEGVAVRGEDGQTILDLLQQVQFFLLEVGFIGGAILAIRRSAELALALTILALLPLAHFGPSNDLVMRASIPSLAVLVICAGQALIERPATVAAGRGKVWLAGLLAIGAVTPVEEIARAVLLPAWPINPEATLIGADCGRYAPHYVARTDNEVIGRLLRRSKRLDLGPQGPGSCMNPAVELMWSRSIVKHGELRALVPLNRTGTP